MSCYLVLRNLKNLSRKLFYLEKKWVNKTFAIKKWCHCHVPHLKTSKANIVIWEHYSGAIVLRVISPPRRQARWITSMDGRVGGQIHPSFQQHRAACLNTSNYSSHIAALLMEIFYQWVIGFSPALAAYKTTRT